MGNFIATCSTMFCKGLFNAMPAWYDAMFPITDWPLHLLNAEHGQVGYINEVLGVYRQHRGGYYSPLSQDQKLAATLAFYHTMNANLNYRYDRLVKTAISKYFYEWAEEYLRRGEVGRARACFKMCLSGGLMIRSRSVRKLLSMAVRLYLPSLLDDEPKQVS